jgi:hypothetical protein
MENSVPYRSLECEKLSTKLDLQDPQKLQLAQQHYHELIEEKRKRALVLVNLLLSSFDVEVSEKMKARVPLSKA